MLMQPEPYTRQQYSDDFKKLCEEEHALTMAKNNDYGAETDPWKNFREFGLIGILVRMSDKWARIKTALWEKRAYEVATETVEDTLRDLSVYSKIAILWLRRQKYEKEYSNVTTHPHKTINLQQEDGYIRGKKFAQPAPIPGQGKE